MLNIRHWTQCQCWMLTTLIIHPSTQPVVQFIIREVLWVQGSLPPVSHPALILPIQLTLNQCHYHFCIYLCSDQSITSNSIWLPWVSVIVDTVTSPNPTTNPISRCLSDRKLHTHRNTTFTSRCRHNWGVPQAVNMPGHHYPHQQQVFIWLVEVIHKLGISTFLCHSLIFDP